MRADEGWWYFKTINATQCKLFGLGNVFYISNCNAYTSGNSSIIVQ